MLGGENCGSVRIQVCPKKGVNPIMLLWGWDWDHQTYSREGSGFLGDGFLCLFFPSVFFESRPADDGLYRNVLFLFQNDLTKSCLSEKPH